jgi:hypothetical protein
MGAIEDVRKVIQDLVAPELKSLQVQIKNVDDSSKLRDEALSAKIDNIDAASKLRDEALSIKIDNLSDKIDRKFENVFAEMKANQAMLIYSLNIDKRLETVERKTAEPMHTT